MTSTRPCRYFSTLADSRRARARAVNPHYLFLCDVRNRVCAAVHHTVSSLIVRAFDIANDCHSSVHFAAIP